MDDQTAFFGRMHIGDVSKKNEEIESLVKELSALCGECSEKARRIIPVYLLHARGQSILNTMAGTLGERYFKCMTPGETPENVLPGSMEPERLAVILEKWFEEYKESWRSTSRESELHRISAVIYWWADFLRRKVR